MKSPHFDLVVIGGGIIGTATAMLLKQQMPTALNVAILEKESSVGYHQSGRNSGVVHMGLYYKPESLKAKLCLQGAFEAFDFFDKHKIPYRKCGKLVVAVKDNELQGLEKLYRNSVTNGVPDVRILDSLKEIQAIEPNCSGKAAIYSPNTAIVDWKEVTKTFAQEFQKAGGTVLYNFKVSELNTESSDPAFPVTITSSIGQRLKARYVLSCCGLYSDRIAQMTGCSYEPRIIPVRGEYLGLSAGEARQLVSTNIYPVPDPNFPFLGVHFTPRMDGSLWLGPNAVLATHREGYSYCDFNLSDTLDLLKYPGFLRLASKYVFKGIEEFTNSVVVNRQLDILKQYVPKLPTGKVYRVSAGVRAQALAPDGTLVDDFVFDFDPKCRVLHVRNAPSPGATSSLAIAKYLLNKMNTDFADLT